MVISSFELQKNNTDYFMRILSIGSLSGLSNTCLHRHWALKRIAGQVDEVNTTAKPCTLWYRIAYHLFLYGLPVRLPENNHENQVIRDFIANNTYELVWIDKGVTIYPETLRYIKAKSPHTLIISYSPDNMALRHNQSYQYLQCIPWYDYVVTNKSYTQEALKKMGAKQVIFVNNSYEPSFHYPRELSDIDREKYGGDVGFVGAWEKERCQSILYLADHGINVRVFGGGKWLRYKDYSPNLRIEEHGLHKEDYAKSLSAFKISLCFLRKMNFDLQTTRTVEIPACGGFMLAERTEEHLAMFKEGEEAAYFSDIEEMLRQCRYYLSHEKERRLIAEKGMLRCITDDYSNEGMIRKVLSIINEKK